MKPRSGPDLILWSSCLAMLAIGANSTAIMAAMPLMQGALSLTPSGVQWAVNAYLVASAACIVLGGRAADQFTAKLSSGAGLALFATASCVIALAESQTALLVGRALQGLAAAFAVPGTLAAINGSAAPERKQAAIGAWTGFLMLGFSIGPLLGGGLAHFTGWRTIFWLNVPLSAAALAGLLCARATGAPPKHTASGPPDIAGFILLATFMVSTVFGLHALPQAGVAPLPAIGSLGLAIVALILLLIVERRDGTPMVNLGFFAQAGFRLGTVVGALAMLSIMSLLLYFNLYAQGQHGLGLTALEAGALLLPLGGSLLVLALSASALSKRAGLRHAMTAGMLLVVLACAILGVAVAETTIPLLAIGLFVMGAGLAIPYALAPRLALTALRPEQAGQGAGIINAGTFLGGSIGVAAGAIAFMIAEFTGVLTMIAVAGTIGAALTLRIPSAD